MDSDNPMMLEHYDLSVSGKAWQAALDMGIDMSLIALSLTKTPWERIQDHEAALALTLDLEAAGRRFHERTQSDA